MLSLSSAFSLGRIFNSLGKEFSQGVRRIEPLNIPGHRNDKFTGRYHHWHKVFLTLCRATW
jgi:hypothetical protein